MLCPLLLQEVTALWCLRPGGFRRAGGDQRGLLRQISDAHAGDETVAPHHWAVSQPDAGRSVDRQVTKWGASQGSTVLYCPAGVYIRNNFSRIRIQLFFSMRILIRILWSKLRCDFELYNYKRWQLGLLPFLIEFVFLNYNKITIINNFLAFFCYFSNFSSWTWIQKRMVCRFGSTALLVCTKILVIIWNCAQGTWERTMPSVCRPPGPRWRHPWRRSFTTSSSLHRSLKLKWSLLGTGTHIYEQCFGAGTIFTGSGYRLLLPAPDNNIFVTQV